MQTLSPNTVLQGGRYTIQSVLGQGGFGVTYLAIQSGLDRKVAIKEFFMKDFCNRDESTSHVSVASEGSQELVERYRDKFLKEARNLAKLNHPNIVKVIDVFEENDTAYFAMEYVENGSLASIVEKEGYLSEPVATRYILQVASALDYIHQQNMTHLDVKPANIMLNNKDEAIIIDFGLSKQYDVKTGNQTSSTPVGISEGYAPLEQYDLNGVGEFSPQTDIYALGATFFKLLTGLTPPKASVVNEDGIPIDELNAKGVSQTAINVITKAMESRKRDRLKSVGEFITMLEAEPENQEETLIFEETPNDEKPTKKSNSTKKKKSKKKIFLYILLGLIAIGAVVFGVMAFIHRPKATFSDGVLSVKGVDYEFVKVEQGTFTMGDENDSVARPTHKVILTNDYYIGKTEVTQELWNAIMGTNPSYFRGDKKPVEMVDLTDVKYFLEQLNRLAQWKVRFRLPSEAEWEFAARGGNKSMHYQYSGSNDANAVAWCGEDTINGSTHDVATKQSNELGLYDMSGNVWEWCCDNSYVYGSNTISLDNYNYILPYTLEGSFITRGGSWGCNDWSVRSANRGWMNYDAKKEWIGFRLIVEIPK